MNTYTESNICGIYLDWKIYGCPTGRYLRIFQLKNILFKIIVTYLKEDTLIQKFWFEEMIEWHLMLILFYSYFFISDKQRLVSMALHNRVYSRVQTQLNLGHFLVHGFYCGYRISMDFPQHMQKSTSTLSCICIWDTQWR